MLQIIQLILFYSWFCMVICRQPCLHNGCEMSGGLKTTEVVTVVSKLLRPGEFKDNLLTAVSWNIRQKDTSSQYQWVTSKKDDVCRFLTRLNPTVLGLQDVNPSQMNYIKLCMTGYTIIKDKNNDVNALQNILILKNTRRSKIRDYGSFTSNVGKNGNFNPSSCTWAKINFAHRLTDSPQFNIVHSNKPQQTMVEKLFDLLALLLPQQNNVTPRHRRSRVRRNLHARYRWSNLFVAVAKINFDSEKSAKNQLEAILMHLRNKVMERRRYPFILLVDVGQEDNSLAYQYLLKNRHWLRNTMAHSMKTFPATTKVNENDPSSEMLGDYVFKHRLHGLFSATISDDIATDKGVSSQRPVLSALFRFR